MLGLSEGPNLIPLGLTKKTMPSKFHHQRLAASLGGLSGLSLSAAMRCLQKLNITKLSRKQPSPDPKKIGEKMHNSVGVKAIKNRRKENFLDILRLHVSS